MRLVPVLLVALALAGCVTPGARQTAAGEDDRDGAASFSDCLSVVGGIDLHAATIPELQAALAAGTITSVQLVDAYLARIEALDNAGPALNSVQVTNPRAREIAAELDAERAAGKVRGPMHGIPVLLKDNIGTTDMPTTAGSIALAENVPPQDATITANLREAGAIILGKAQLSEFANWVSLTMPSGYSSLGGQVVNAYTGGDPSGSSSGSGVSASMAFATIAVGSETSGSILSPSIANSLVGVKPTMGLLSRAGIIPLAPSFDVPGPMGRNVVDAALMLNAMAAGPDARDPATAAAPSERVDHTLLLEPNALEGVRLGYATGDDDPAFQEALAKLEELGAELVPFERGDADSVSITEIGLIPNEFKASLNAYLATEAGPGLPISTLEEIVVYNQGRPEMKYGQDLLIASAAQPGVLATVSPLATGTIAASRATADRLFAENDVVAIVGRNAPFTNLGAAAGYPTVVVPLGYEGGEPVGLSFFGQPFTEPQLLSYAFAYEQATNARVPPHMVRGEILDGVCG